MVKIAEPAEGRCRLCAFKRAVLKKAGGRWKIWLRGIAPGDANTN